jgi:hypothetical protein
MPQKARRRVWLSLVWPEADHVRSHGRMDVHSREQYLNELRREYQTASKQEKSHLLDEAMKRTHLTRKHLIVKLCSEAPVQTSKRRRRRRTYDGTVSAPLARIWALFDYPCGQRLAALLRQQTQHLLQFGIIRCSKLVADRLRSISPKTIDRLLSGERDRLRLNRYRNPSLEPLLHQKIPVKVPTDWDREQLGNLQLDFVLHCGPSLMGHFVHSLSADDIATGWWEGRAQMGRSQVATLQSLDSIRASLPFPILEIHPDNDSGLVNHLLFRYCRQHQIAFSRSRPLHKNDNAWVEQRNWTHIRKEVGYRRFDSPQACDLLNQLYIALAQWKNFFLPTMKLIEKRRVRGKIHRRYDEPKTPYQRVIESGQLPTEALQILKATFDGLNPVELKRTIERCKKDLFNLLEPNVKQTKPSRRVSPRLVRSFMTQPTAAWLDC